MKLKVLLIIAVAALCGVFIGGCRTSKDASESTSIPYQLAQHYFVRNDVNGLPPTTITTADEFDKYFGMAAVMGKNGTPTEIDFNKSFVICLTVAPTDINTELSVVSLTITKADQLALNYRIKQGEKMSYTSQPLLLLIVDKKYELPVVLNAAD